MKRNLTLVFLGIVIGLGIAAVAWAATVNVFPDVEVQAAVKSRAIWGVCVMGGYPNNPGTPLALADPTAQNAFYRQWLINEVRNAYIAAQRNVYIAANPDVTGDIPQAP